MAANNSYMFSNYGYGYGSPVSGGYRPTASGSGGGGAVQQQQQQQYSVGYSQPSSQQTASMPQGYAPAPVGQQSVSPAYQQQQQQVAASSQQPYSASGNSVSATAVAYPSTAQSYASNPYSAAASSYYQKQQHQQARATNMPYNSQSQQQPQQQQSQQQQEQYTPQQAQVIQDYINVNRNQPTGGKKQGTWWKANQGANQQTFYCETCKISCVSPTTYKTHLDGKAHKKKAAGSSAPTNVTTFKCTLCDVVCTSKDAVEGHFRGAKHQKVVKLHQKLGKPVPPTYEVTSPSSATTEVSIPDTPRITFVAGKQLSMSDSGGDGTAGAIPKVYPPLPPTVVNAMPTPTPTPTAAISTESAVEVKPVGLELVTVLNKDPKYPHAKYKCIMCDCYFNDEYAKNMHCKGRRHRLNYKKNYQPDLKVEPTKQMKQSMEKKRKRDQEKRKSKMVGRPPRQGDHHPQDGRPPYDFYPGPPPGYFKMGGDWGHPRRPIPRKGINPRDDKVVLNKHSLVYPSDEELKEVQNTMVEIEKSLKQISDILLAEECTQLAAKEGKEQCADMPVKRDEKMRELMGVMRVGALARGLMLRGERKMEVVLMIKSKPTSAILNKIVTILPEKLAEATSSSGGPSYGVVKCEEKSAVVITANYEPHPLQVTATLTCTEMRGQVNDEILTVEREAGVLDRPSCLAALAALRRTKWFQSMAHSLPSCVIVLRVFKELCRSTSGLQSLSAWAQELVVQKCIASANPDYSKPSDVIRRLFECLSSGVFLPGHGLLDPCEREQMDSSAYMSPADRETVTSTAQHMLRSMAFGRLHEVLGVEPVPVEGNVPTKRAAGDGDFGAPPTKLARAE